MISPGRALILIGLVLLILGFFISGQTSGISWVDSALKTFFGWFKWLGHLPGDFIFEKGGFTIYLPIGSSILVSIGLTILFWFLRRIL